MDRRVFQPRNDNSTERRRNALSMSILILVGGGLWLYYSHHHPALIVRPVSEKSIPVRTMR